MLFFMLLCTLVLASCGKEKTNADAGCKTCKAFGANADQQTVTEQVCGSQAETAFRNQYAGREITCQ